MQQTGYVKRSPQTHSSSVLFDTIKARQYTAEFFGTFFLVFIYEILMDRLHFSIFNITIGTIWLLITSISFGAVVMVLVYTSQFISGAHFNPAVSLAVMFKFNFKRKGPLVLYMVFQILGAVGAAILHYYLFSIPHKYRPTVYYARTKNAQKHVQKENPYRFQPIDYRKFEPYEPNGFILFLIEFILTFLLVHVYFQVIYNRSVVGNSYYGLAIGLVYMVSVVIIGPIEGGSINPAIWFGHLISILIFGRGRKIRWIYIIAQIAAAFAVWLFHKWAFPDDCDECPPYTKLPTQDTGDQLRGGDQIDIQQAETKNFPHQHPIDINSQAKQKDAQFLFNQYQAANASNPQLAAANIEQINQIHQDIVAKQAAHNSPFRYPPAN